MAVFFPCGSAKENGLSWQGGLGQRIRLWTFRQIDGGSVKASSASSTDVINQLIWASSNHLTRLFSKHLFADTVIVVFTAISLLLDLTCVSKKLSAEGLIADRHLAQERDFTPYILRHPPFIHSDLLLNRATDTDPHNNIPFFPLNKTD